MGLIVGTDLYGRVKKVEGIPVVTTFAMLQFLPLYPVQSFYLISTGPKQTEGVPFIVSSESVTIDGIPLARIDRWSVLTAYVRMIFAIMFLFSFLGSFVNILGPLTAPNLSGNTGSPVWFGVLAVATIGGGLTYVCGKGPQRERLIRKYCGELLGICVDPARVPYEICKAFDQHLSERPDDGSDVGTRLTALKSLVRIRMRIAEGEDSAELESQTDELLKDLDASIGA